MKELLRPVVLLGPPGAGKSSLGRVVAERAGLPFVDVDERVRRRRGKTPAELLQDEGEASFRATELLALQAVLDETPPALVAAGSGIVTTAEARELLRRRARMIVVDVSEEEGLRRLCLDNAEPRPLLAQGDERVSGGRYRALVESRRAFFGELAPDRVDTTGMTPEKAAEALFDVVTQADRPVTPRADVSDEAAFVVEDATHPLAGASSPRALVLDDGVPQSLALQALLEAHGDHPIVQVTGGEACKSLDEAGHLAARLVDTGFPPDGVIVAAGGGAVLDLAGFVAAILYRGVRWMAAPTTLLAMADAGLGGKTAVDLAAGKNLIGAFHAPSLVVIDPRFVWTLPERERKAGVAEMLKHAFLASDAPDDGRASPEDAGLPKLARGDASPDEVVRLVRRSLALKSAVTRADPRERGLRRVLNLGHTFGHALEHESSLVAAPLLHGEAVAYGLRFALALSRERGLLDADVGARLFTRVDELDVTRAPHLDVDRLIERMAVDKKRRGADLRFIALAGPGRPIVLADVPPSCVRACVREALS